MKITQISVFLENRSGRLYDVCMLLGENGINIRALNVAETESFGVLRMVVSDSAAAVKALKDGGFVANITEVVAVEVSDKPGGLAVILKALSDEDIDVEYMYGFVEKETNKALMVFRFENIDEAVEVLNNNEIKIATKEEIEGL